MAKRKPMKKTIKKKIVKILDQMIDDLYDAGVDVSYFPEKAEEVLRKAAEKITNLLECLIEQKK